MLLHSQQFFFLSPVGCSVAQKEFVLGFQEHRLGSEGRVYVVNPSLTATATVSVITPLLAEGTPGSVNGSLTLSPGTADYITVPNMAHMTGSSIENKGNGSAEIVAISCTYGGHSQKEQKVYVPLMLL